MSEISLADKVHRLELLHRIGLALSAEQNRDRLLETILIEAKTLCAADGGSLYLRTDDDRLRFAIVRNDSLGLALGGTTGKPIAFPPIPLLDPESGAPNHANVATHTAHLRCSVNIADAYATDRFDFSGTKAFDARHGYRSTSFLTIPLVNGVGRVIGVLQLINSVRDGQIVPFRADDQQIVEALASQAAIALDNQILLEGQRILLESFIRLIAAAIDAKSPYTGGHCERVPILVEMLAKAACETHEGALSEFDLTAEEWYELRIAAWLHDCGKIVTPVHVMDKATKLETIHDRIDEVAVRFELIAREAELRMHTRLLEPGADRSALEAELERERAALADDLAFLRRVNRGGEFLSPADRERIRSIGGRTYRFGESIRPVLSPEEVETLSISRGTLTEDERLVINGHMVETIRMLEALPFPRNLHRVPEFAGGHHEKMDGTGYPKGLFAGDMSIPARIMAVADVFEALTAQDRPYKPGKPLSESMAIMGHMKRRNHLDPEVFDLFVRSGVYRRYAERFLPEALIDEVDEAALIAIVPDAFELPSSVERQLRWRSFLPEYGKLVRPLPRLGQG